MFIFDYSHGWNLDISRSTWIIVIIFFIIFLWVFFLQLPSWKVITLCMDLLWLNMWVYFHPKIIGIANAYYFCRVFKLCMWLLEKAACTAIILYMLIFFMFYYFNVPGPHWTMDWFFIIGDGMKEILRCGRAFFRSTIGAVWDPRIGFCFVAPPRTIFTRHPTRFSFLI